MKIIRHPLFMRPTPESDLEQRLDLEFRRLPPLRAPEDLLPRVMTAVARHARRPWWMKPAAQWPVPARLAFLAFSTGLVGLLIYFTWGLSSGASFSLLTDEVAEFSGRLDLARSLGGALAGAGVALVRSAGPWLTWSAVGLVAVCYLTTLTLGTYCYRLASERI